MATNWEQIATQPSNTQGPTQNPNQGAFTGAINNATVGDAWSNIMGPLGQLARPVLNQIPGLNTKAVDVPFWGGLGGSIAKPLARAGEYAADAFVTPATDLATKGKITNANNYMSPNDFKTIQGGGLPAITNTLGTGLGAAGAVTEAKGLGELPQIAMNASKILPLLTKSGAGKAIGAASEAATKAGVTDSAPDLVTEFKQAVEDRLGGPGGMAGDPALQKSYGKMLQVLTGRGDVTPETLAKYPPNEFAGNFNPSQLIQGRQNIVSRFGYSPTDEGTLDTKVANIARDIFSKRAKDITPGLATADKAYTIHSKFQDALPSLLNAAGLGKVAAGGVGTYALAKMLLGQNQNDQNQQ